MAERQVAKKFVSKSHRGFHVAEINAYVRKANKTRNHQIDDKHQEKSKGFILINSEGLSP